MRSNRFALVFAPLTLAACSAPRWKPPAITYNSVPHPAVLQPNPPKPVHIVELPRLLPLPGQLKPIGRAQNSGSAQAQEPANPRLRVDEGNAAARVQPSRTDYINAIQVYPWSKGALYQVYSAPGEVTDIALQRGETLTGSGPVAAGDTVRWIIGDTESGTGANRRVHILVKPTHAGLNTNLVINTDRRTYHLELHSDPKTYMAAVSWTYPEDELFALRRQNEASESAAPIIAGVNINDLNFRYRIQGAHPPWRPIRAFDDGRQVFIEFPPGIAEQNMPPLWVIGAQGGAELVNYRVEQNYMVVDRLFAAAELRLGAKHQQIVRIVRTDGVPQP